MATKVSPSEVSKALDAIRRPLAPPPWPRVSLRVRLSTTPWLRRLLPRALVVRRAEAHGRAIWKRDPEVREEALAALEAILSGTPRAAEIATLAPKRPIEQEAIAALFWQPWKPAQMEEGSRLNLRAALDSGRGVLLSPIHQGPTFRTAATVVAHGGNPYVVVAPWFFASPSNDYEGRRIAYWWSRLRTGDQYLVPSVGSFAVLRELLQERETVMVYFDMPGTRETHFLGKPVMLSAGTARLATETDAVILPMRARRAGLDIWIDAAEPLDPRNMKGMDELHEALAAIHERWILELPEALEDPLRPGAWEAGARAESWIPPQRRRASTA